MARSIAASLMRPVAEMPSPSRMIRENEFDHAKSVAGRTGDQKPAIVGAEVERGVDAGAGAGTLSAPLPAASGTCRACARPKAVAKPRIIIHQMSFRGQAGPTRNFRSRKL